MPFSSATPDAFERALRAGQVFAATRDFELQNGGDTFSLVVDVPADSPSETLIFGVAVNVTGRSFVRVVDNPTEDTQGTTITPNNRRVGSSKVAATNIRLAGTNETGAYSGGSIEGPALIGGEAVGAEGVPAQDDSSTLTRTIPPGQLAQFEVEADQNAREGSIGLVFAEGEVF
jgi:hypothetical protein